MKPFRKRTKKIMVNGFQFHCVIDEHFRNKYVSFRVYPYNTKTSFFEVHFSWEGTWFFNLNLPSICSTLIMYVIQNGWEYTQEKKQLVIENGDFLIKELALEEKSDNR
ncbi:hypothetical protein SAMN04487970_106128 [Paenibacillus tianmuensis]|uniref:Uncharacterized protein n=1 Tax=Paenibacillus tianmuensis TaxID=624147 RepID=A0A1G4TRS5_9BACL|nr:hypothetical protein SAMN04487970_106128 [Paenibacillus tianmuensis]